MPKKSGKNKKLFCFVRSKWQGRPKWQESPKWQCRSERERVIGVHERRSFFRDR